MRVYIRVVCIARFGLLPYEISAPPFQKRYATHEMSEVGDFGVWVDKALSPKPWTPIPVP